MKPKNTTLILKGIVAVMLLLCLSLSLKAQNKLLTADQFFSNALKQSSIEKKPVLLLCYGNSNPWSTVIDSIVSNKQCAGILNKYYVVRKVRAREDGWAAKHADLVGANQLFDRLYTKDSAAATVPVLFIIDKSGKKLGQYSGYPENMDAFTNMLSVTSAITPGERKFLSKALSDAYLKNGVASATDVLNNAITQAKKTHKKVFLIFNASWCHWCHVLDTAMNEPSAKEFFDKSFVIAHIVAHESAPHLKKQNLGADKMLFRYQGPNRNGIPFWIIFDEDGNKLADYNGFPSPHYADDYAAFEKILQNTAGASDTDLAKIKKAFSDLSLRNGIHD